MKWKRRCARSSPTPTIPPKAAARPHSPRSFRRRRRCAGEPSPWFSRVETSTRVFSPAFSRADPEWSTSGADRKNSIGGVDVYQSELREIIAKNAVAGNEAGVLGPINDHVPKAQRSSPYRERQLRNDTIAARSGSRQPEHASAARPGDRTYFLEHRRGEQRRLCAGIEREVQRQPVLRTDFDQRLTDPHQILRRRSRRCGFRSCQLDAPLLVVEQHVELPDEIPPNDSVDPMVRSRAEAGGTLEQHH